MNSEDHVLLTYISKKCKALRANHGLSQEVVLNDTGIHIGRIETAKRDVSISTIEKICTYFEISIADFFKDYHPI